jgi:hypothetical protein
MTNAQLLARLEAINQEYKEATHLEVLANIEADNKRKEAIRKAGVEAIERARTFA